MKLYIKNQLASSFIQLSRFFVKVFIFFDQKLDESLKLYINYQGLNNFTNKNKYLLLLVGKLLN